MTRIEPESEWARLAAAAARLGATWAEFVLALEAYRKAKR